MLSDKLWCIVCGEYVHPICSGKEVDAQVEDVRFTYVENSSSCPQCHCGLYDPNESDKNALRREREYWKAKAKKLENERLKK